MYSVHSLENFAKKRFPPQIQEKSDCNQKTVSKQLGDLLFLLHFCIHRTKINSLLDHEHCVRTKLKENVILMRTSFDEILCVLNFLPFFKKPLISFNSSVPGF